MLQPVLQNLVVKTLIETIISLYSINIGTACILYDTILDEHIILFLGKFILILLWIIKFLSAYVTSYFTKFSCENLD